MAAIWRWYKNRAPVEKVRPKAATGGAERRGPPRYVVNTKAILNLISLSHTSGRSVQIQDISTHGIGLCAASPVEIGTFFVLEMRRGSTPPVRLKGRVVRQTSAGKGRWSLGCIFLTELTEEQLHALL